MLDTSQWTTLPLAHHGFPEHGCDLHDELAWIEAPNLGRKEAAAVAHQWLLGSTDRIEHPSALQVTKYTKEATEVPEPFC